VSADPIKIMESLSELYRLKEDPSTKKTFGKPDRYLGANIGEYVDTNFSDCLTKILSGQRTAELASKIMYQ
jgi:hypothetical protein